MKTATVLLLFSFVLFGAAQSHEEESLLEGEFNEESLEWNLEWAEPWDFGNGEGIIINEPHVIPGGPIIPVPTHIGDQLTNPGGPIQNVTSPAINVLHLIPGGPIINVPTQLGQGQ